MTASNCQSANNRINQTPMKPGAGYAGRWAADEGGANNSMSNSLLSYFLLMFVSILTAQTTLWYWGGIGRPMIDRRFLPLLSGRPEDEQKRLIDRAEALAFGGWRIVLRGVPMALFMAAAITLPRAMLQRTNFWLQAAVAGIISGLGVIPATRVTSAYINHFLKVVLRDEDRMG